MGRSPCCSKEEGLNRGAWTAMEDKILTEYIRDHGEGKWRNLPKKAGLKRCGKSCRLRWLNYLRPDIKRGNITHDEEELIIRLHKLLGNRWSLIAGRLPGRTDNEIKNYWNTNIGKKIQGMTRTTSFSSNHKQPSKEKPNNPKPGQQFTASPPSPKTKPFVVRTKATRCAKFFISPELQNNLDHQIDTKPEVLGSPVAIELKDNNMDQSEPLVLFNSEEDKLSNFMIDDLDQVDDRFLSDLLNADFSEFCDFGENNGVEAENNNQPPSTAHESSPYSSPNSEQTLLVSEDNLDDPCDLQSMASLLDSQLDWI